MEIPLKLTLTIIYNKNEIKYFLSSGIKKKKYSSKMSNAAKSDLSDEYNTRVSVYVSYVLCVCVFMYGTHYVPMSECAGGCLLLLPSFTMAWLSPLLRALSAVVVVVHPGHPSVLCHVCVARCVSASVKANAMTTTSRVSAARINELHHGPL